MESSPEIKFNLAKSTGICAPQVPILCQEGHCLSECRADPSANIGCQTFKLEDIPELPGDAYYLLVSAWRAQLKR